MLPTIAKRAEEIQPFLAMEVSEKARSMEHEGVDIIHLEIGEPDFGVPEWRGLSPVFVCQFDREHQGRAGPHRAVFERKASPTKRQSRAAKQDLVLLKKRGIMILEHTTVLTVKAERCLRGPTIMGN